PLKNIREVLYSHIKKINLLIPGLISNLLSTHLKDLTEASTEHSRSIAEVKVDVNVVIDMNHSREINGSKCTTTGDRLTINLSSSTEQSRFSFLLSLNTDRSIVAVVLEQMYDKVEEETKNFKDTSASKEYQLLYQFIIEGNYLAGKKLLIAPDIEPENTPSFVDECHKRLLAKIHAHPVLIRDMVNHAKAGGKSETCIKFMSKVAHDHLQDIKSCRDRVKNLTDLFNKTVDSIARDISDKFDMGRLKNTTIVTVNLKEVSFGVSVDNDSTTRTTTTLNYSLHNE
ncbi:MAG TPA: hypothetical protein VFU89_04495, partial [Rhabdochlamydiaceae bacterium]|nr:hypothetical protein [Rhabdochlamydiaceae bacterium]